MTVRGAAVCAALAVALVVAAAQAADSSIGDAAAQLDERLPPPPSEPSPPVNPHPERELLLVVELCRHGDRTPLYTYPNDALPALRWPEGVGALTGAGARAHYELGARLRRRYVSTGFLPWSFLGADLYVRSTTIDRALLSAYSQMAGLYPAGSAPVVDVRSTFGGEAPAENATGLPGRWQPVPIHSVPLATDGLLIPGMDCPRHAQLMRDKERAPEWTAREAAEAGFLAQLTSIVGSHGRLSLRAVSEVNDVWVCYEHHGVPLPEGVTRAVRQKTHEIATWLVLYGNEGGEVRRLRAGLLLNEIKLRLQIAARRREGTLAPAAAGEAKKFVLYSAHDSTVAAALSALDVRFDANPPYNSTLIWELWYDAAKRKFLVSVEYNGAATHIPGCPAAKSPNDRVCALDDYVQATGAVTVSSSAARMRECMSSGLRRQMSFVASWFGTDKADEVGSGGAQVVAGGRGDQQAGGNGGLLSWAHLVLLLALVSGAAVLIVKARGQYVHYFPLEAEGAAGGQRSSGPSLFQGKDDRGILL
jgi:lysosomal acid phosphatase